MAKIQFEPQDNGRGFKFRVDGLETDWIVVPGELLDDEISNEASEAERIGWIEDNMTKIVEAYQAKVSGGIVRKPFDRILVWRKQ